MKYNQNRKIEQITDSTLIIGVDIAKHNHVARAQDFRGILLSKPLAFENSREGFNQFLYWMRTIMLDHEKHEVLVGMEPTGHYWMAFAQCLRHEGIKVVLVNTHHVSKSKELDDNSPTKNDVKDARVIAQLVKDGRYSEPTVPEGIYADLRVGMNMRDRLSEDLQRVQGRMVNWLDRFFPEFFTVFKDWTGKAALVTLRNFPFPQDIVGLEPMDIVLCWKKEVQRAVGLKRAELLLGAAKQSIGLADGLMMARQELRALLNQYDAVIQELEALEQIIEGLLKQVPGVKEMMSIPGVGLVTIAGFLAEVGDLNQYSHPRQIQKLAGFNLKEHSSGKHKGQTKITKRGRPRLRRLLYACIMPMVAKNNEFKALHQHFITRTENPLKKKQSLIALCNKLIRLLFTLGKRQVAYNPVQCLGDVRLQQLQEVA